MPSGKKSVALLLDDPQNLYQQLQTRETLTVASAFGISPLPTEWANGSSWTQLESINAMLRKEARPDAVLIILAGGLTRGALDRLAKAGIALVFLQRIPDWFGDLHDAWPETLVAGVSPRQEALGAIQARHALRLARPGGLVLLVTGDMSTPAAIKRKQGFLDAVGNRLQVQALDGRWSPRETERAVGEWLRLSAERDKPIELVVCANDAMAMGAKKALEHHAAAASRKDLLGLPLIGCDGLEQEGKPMLARGELSATIVVPSTAPKALELLRDYWATGARPDAVVLLEGTSLPPL